MPKQPLQVPWALHLFDRAGRAWLLAFDFDDTPGRGRAGRARKDALVLSRWLAARDVPHVLCRSGGREGRHLWLRLSSPVDAELVRRMAYAAKRRFPTLDIGPLCNARSGAVRPPGSPHRSGGVSTPLRTAGRPAGEALEWADQGTVPGIVEDLLAWCNRSPACTAGSGTQDRSFVTVTEKSPRVDSVRGALAGRPRGLSAQAMRLASQPLGARDDGSAIAWRVLLSAAHARWSRAEVHRAAQACPGLAHLTMARTGTGLARVPRRDPARHIDRQWDRALRAAAAWRRPAAESDADPSPGEDRGRLEADMAQILTAAGQDRLFVSSRAGCTRRVVLEAIVATIYQAGSREVDLSVRSWALLAGLSRTATHQAVIALLAAGWLVRTRDSDGPWAARHTVVIPPAHGRWTHTFPPPTEAGAPALAARLAHHRQDVWTHPSLGPAAARLHYTLLQGRYASTEALATAAGSPAGTCGELLGALRALGLVDAQELRGLGGTERLTRAAQVLGTCGVLERRRRLYEAESAAWAWWCAEQEWRRARMDTLSSASEHHGSPAVDRGWFPTRAGGGMDWARALEQTRAGAAAA